MNWLRTKLLALFSERDNTTPDVVRVVGGILAFIGGIEYLFLSAWDVIKNHVPFAHEGFGAGLSLVIAALGAAVAAKALTEKH
jgi:hypothetical protein